MTWHSSDEDLAALADALGHPARVRTLRILLQRGPLAVKDLVRELPIVQATVSQHLKILREAGLLVAKKSGRTVRYEVEPSALRRLSSQVASLAVAASAPRPPPRE